MMPASTVRRFAEIAKQSPDRIAVASDTAELTYARLAAIAGGQACRLFAANVRPGTRVGLVTGHGTATITAVLATLAAGCAYVPLDPSFPRDRLDYQLTAAGVSVVLADP
jgi:non-ribosomal peptide synthetase component F